MHDSERAMAQALEVPVRISDIAVIGESTNDNGPFADDRKAGGLS